MCYIFKLTLVVSSSCLAVGVSLEFLPLTNRLLSCHWYARVQYLFPSAGQPGLGGTIIVGVLPTYPLRGPA
jgi:hypothetical protein